MTPWKSHNGDTIDELHRLKLEIEARLTKWLDEHKRIETLLKPIEEEIENASFDLVNIQTRLDMWRQGFDAYNRKVK